MKEGLFAACLIFLIATLIPATLFTAQRSGVITAAGIPPAIVLQLVKASGFELACTSLTLFCSTVPSLASLIPHLSDLYRQEANTRSRLRHHWMVHLRYNAHLPHSRFDGRSQGEAPPRHTGPPQQHDRCPRGRRRYSQDYKRLSPQGSILNESNLPFLPRFLYYFILGLYEQQLYYANNFIVTVTTSPFSPLRCRDSRVTRGTPSSISLTGCLRSWPDPFAFRLLLGASICNSSTRRSWASGNRKLLFLRKSGFEAAFRASRTFNFFFLPVSHTFGLTLFSVSHSSLSTSV